MPQNPSHVAQVGAGAMDRAVAQPGVSAARPSLGEAAAQWGFLSTAQGRNPALEQAFGRRLARGTNWARKTVVTLSSAPVIL